NYGHEFSECERPGEQPVRGRQRSVAAQKPLPCFSLNARFGRLLGLLPLYRPPAGRGTALLFTPLPLPLNPLSLRFLLAPMFGKLGLPGHNQRCSARGAIVFVPS